jgi:hypothetical protein
MRVASQCCRGVAVITEDDQYWHLRQGGDLLGGVPGWAATRLDEHETFWSGGIDQRRFQRKRSGLRVSHQHCAIQLAGEIRQCLERWVGCRDAAKADVGHTLLREFVHGVTGNWLSE